MSPEEPSPGESTERGLDLVFQCLADRSRRQILALLREAEELRVGDLAKAFSMSLNGVSKHVKALEKAGLVERRKVGREHWIRVQWPALKPAFEWLNFHQHFWSTRLDRLARLIEPSAEVSSAKRKGPPDASNR